MTDKKKLASMILMSMKPKAGEEEEPEEDMTEDESETSDEEAAAQEVIDAIKAEDAAGLVEALKSFVSMC